MKTIRLNLWPLGGGFSFLIAGFLALTPSWSYAGNGTEAASFLDIPVGGGPAALGSAYTALATDAYAPVWNPAGLGFVESTQLAGQHLDYLESIHDEFLSFVQPLSKSRTSNRHGALGGSVQYLGSGSITGTDKLGNSTGDFSSHFAAYTLAYGQTLTEKLALGIAGKIINAKIADVSANAYAGDAGVMYKATPKVTLAGGITNVGTKLTFLNDGGTLPVTYKAAVAYRPQTQWTLSAEADRSGSGLTSGHFGAEWRPVSLVALRAGYRTDNTKGQDGLVGLTTGIGLNVWGQELSYAWVPYGDLGNTQYFSLLMRFGQAAEEKRNLIQYNAIKKHRTAMSPEDIQRNDPDYKQLMQLLSDVDREVYTRNPLPKGDVQ